MIHILNATSYCHGNEVFIVFQSVFTCIGMLIYNHDMHFLMDTIMICLVFNINQRVLTAKT